MGGGRRYDDDDDDVFYLFLQKQKIEREKVRGVYGFSSLMKQKIKAKNYAVFCFAGFFFKKKFCYEVIVKQKIYKRSTNHYCCERRLHSSSALYTRHFECALVFLLGEHLSFPGSWFSQK